MTSYRWFALSTDHRAMTLAELRAAITSGYRSEEWVEVQAVNEDSISGDYFKRSSIKVRSHDPETGVSSSVVGSIVQLDFVASVKRGMCLLRIRDTSRAAGSLISFLSRAAGFGFVACPLQARAVVGAERELFRSFDSYRLVGLKLSDVAVSPSVLGRFEFVSRFGIAIADIDEQLLARSRISMARFELVRMGVPGTLGVYSSGRITVSGQLSDWLMDFVESSIIGS